MSLAGIREKIDKLEEVKDSILNFLEAAPIPDPATREMWTADAKEAFFQVVAAYDLLPSGRGGQEVDYSPSARAFLEGAGSRVRQVTSELRAFKVAAADDLASRLQQAFDETSKAISAQLGSEPQGMTPIGPVQTITRLGDRHYELRCSSCGRAAAVFKVEVPEISTKGERAILFEGVVKSTRFDISKEAIFGSLEKGDLRALHGIVEEMSEGGLDAYCPSCDKVYCRDHYRLEEEWDEGFYDCTYGTCPEGHRRLLND